jgi:DNA-binding CsgD family transcriptional regulator
MSGWLDAHEALASADRAAPLGGEDLERLATTAYMLGRDDEYLAALERAHHARLEAGEPLLAARDGFWLGMQLMLAGEVGRASGWLGRAQRIVDGHPQVCAERGYLLLPIAFRREAMGEIDGAIAAAQEAAAIAQRFADDDLFALALQAGGHILTVAGRVEEGLRLLDEAMVAMATAEVSPIVKGVVYCGAIMGCQAAYDPRRAQEWTAELSRWCLRQPDMIAFSGRCHVHRAELMQLRGAWSEALDEARMAADRAARGHHRGALGEAAYVQGEVHRLRGELPAAERAYREASRHGRDPQPGLALLRLAEGNGPAAAAAIRRALAETPEVAGRARLLPAQAEIALAAGDPGAAREACDELERIAADNPIGVLAAVLDQTRGAVALAEGDAGAALPSLRRAWRVWEEVDAPYEAARVRALMGAACRALGDEDAAAVELEDARRAFAELGAAPDLAGLAPGTRAGSGLLTPREVEVLRLVAAGRTNKAIAVELVLSERTVDRHVSNIFTKLTVSSRAAATAYAYEHRLL